jgi:hypothetical protein
METVTNGFWTEHWHFSIPLFGSKLNHDLRPTPCFKGAKSDLGKLRTSLEQDLRQSIWPWTDAGSQAMSQSWRCWMKDRNWCSALSMGYAHQSIEEANRSVASRQQSVSMGMENHMTQSTVRISSDFAHEICSREYWSRLLEVTEARNWPCGYDFRLAAAISSWHCLRWCSELKAQTNNDEWTGDNDFCDLCQSILRNDGRIVNDTWHHQKFPAFVSRLRSHSVRVVKQQLFRCKWHITYEIDCPCICKSIPNRTPRFLDWVSQYDTNMIWGVFDPLFSLLVVTCQISDRKHVKKLIVVIEECMRVGMSPKLRSDGKPWTPEIPQLFLNAILKTVELHMLLSHSGAPPPSHGVLSFLN